MPQHTISERKKKKSISERLSEFIFGSGELKKAAEGPPKPEQSSQDTTFVQEAIRKTMERKRQDEEAAKKKKK